MFEKMKYLVQLVSAENEEFVFPSISRDFEIEALDIKDAVWVADAHLSKMDATGYKEDYDYTNYSDDMKSCEVVFKDADKGMDMTYVVKEVQ